MFLIFNKSNLNIDNLQLSSPVEDSNILSTDELITLILKVMELKVNDIITYNFKNEDIYLEVIPTKANSCEDCFFYKNEKICCSAIKNIIGECDKNNRTDKTPVIFREIIKKENTIDSNKQSSGIYKKDILGKWINIDDINPIKIKDIKPGDYVILRVQYESIKFDYKLAYVDCIRNKKVMFNIQSINVLRTPIKITDFCILPDYISDNFYKTNK